MSVQTVLDWLPETLVDGEGKVHRTADVCSNKWLGLYFSAKWCGPCRKTTPGAAHVEAFVCAHVVTTQPPPICWRSPQLIICLSV